MKGPWESPSAVYEATFSGDSYGADISLAWLYFYQHYMSVVVRSECPMHPSCSTYSIAAVRKHGVVRGCVLTCDRLFHEADEKITGKRIVVNGKLKALDMVEDNDFWWRHGNDQN